MWNFDEEEELVLLIICLAVLAKNLTFCPEYPLNGAQSQIQISPEEEKDGKTYSNYSLRRIIE